MGARHIACRAMACLGLPYSPATARNRRPIARVLARALPRAGCVLEIASGTGEHAVWLAHQMPWLDWRPSERDPEMLATIPHYRDAAGLANLLAAAEIDVTRARWGDDAASALGPFVAVVAINLLHIAPWAVCEGLFAGAARLLAPGAPLALYGPFRIGGAHTAPSNESFDRMLRRHDPAWGVRDLENVSARAKACGFDFARSIAMPANNLTLLYRRATFASGAIPDESDPL
jgi:hypothetical protein